MRNHRNVEHLWRAVKDMIPHGGQPAKCDICQEAHFATGLPRSDLMQGGLPCQVASVQRCKNGQTPRTTANADDHPDYATIMSHFMELVDLRRPRVICVEEVPAFATMKLCGKTLYSIFRRKLYAKGYYTKAVIFKHEICCPMSSTRPHAPSASFS